MNLEISLPVLTVFAQGLLSFFLPLRAAAGSAVSGLSRGRVQDSRRGRKHPLPARQGCAEHPVLCAGHQLCLFPAGARIHRRGALFLRAEVAAHPDRRHSGHPVRSLPAGVFGHSGTLSRERRLPLRLDRLAMGPLAALLLGFVFSFGWTPVSARRWPACW